ncbi:MAG: hypothetical protein R3E96_04280 [Planctomycetota bacterium]
MQTLRHLVSIDDLSLDEIRSLFEHADRSPPTLVASRTPAGA